MNKLWSILFFAVALIVSWNMMNSSPAIGSETHSGIQMEMAKLIMQTLAAKKPDAKNLRVTRLWTEALDENKVRAVFAYSFQEGTSTAGENVEQTIEGEAILHREPSDDQRQDRWVLQQVHTTNNQMNFSEGTVVTPTESPEATAPTAQ